MSPKPSRKLKRAFYSRPTLDVARDLLGCHLVYECDGERLAARLVEVEAYVAFDDPACHAAVGRTPRTEVMFGPPGHAYIYFIYGMYYCLNVVTEPQARAAAVLIRAAEPLEGLEIMRTNSPRIRKDDQLLAGPGRLCRSFGLTIDQNGLDLTGSALYIVEGEAPVRKYRTSPRIGIRKATRREWRFFDPNSRALSRAVKAPAATK